jgi:5-hydroxyisourate hydrolase-like protein (transthyretin family)
MLEFLMLFLGALTQVVFVGQQPTKAEMDKFCNSERVRPNLKLQHQTHVSGRVTDIVGVPFKKSQVELRKYISENKQVAFKVSTTDDNGEFDLGKIEKGEYRLLASPTRYFKQPEELHCPGKECKLTIALQANPTDLPESGCPIR